MVDPNQIAINALRQATQLAPDNLERVFHLAQTLNTMVRFDESIQVFKDALERFPDNRRLADGNTTNAIASYREAIDLSPELVDHELESLLGIKRSGSNEEEDQEIVTSQ